MPKQNLKQNYKEFKNAVLALANQSLDLYNSCFDQNGDDNNNVEELFNLLDKDPEIKAVYDALIKVTL